MKECFACLCACAPYFCTLTYIFYVDVRWQHREVSTCFPSLPTCRSRRLKSGIQTWQQAFLPAEPSHRPPRRFFYLRAILPPRPVPVNVSIDSTWKSLVIQKIIILYGSDNVCFLLKSDLFLCLLKGIQACFAIRIPWQVSFTNYQVSEYQKNVHTQTLLGNFLKCWSSNGKHVSMPGNLRLPIFSPVFIISFRAWGSQNL